MNGCFWLLIALISPMAHAATSVVAGPHWWRETAELPSSSPAYSLQGEQAWLTGQALFSGAVIVPSCPVSMDNPWQSVSLGEKTEDSAPRSQRSYDTLFTLQFHDCDLTNSAQGTAAGSRVKVMFYRLSKGSSASSEHNDTEFHVVDQYGMTAHAGHYIPGSRLDATDSSLKYKMRFVHDDNEPNKNVTIGVLISQE